MVDALKRGKSIQSLITKGITEPEVPVVREIPRRQRPLLELVDMYVGGTTDIKLSKPFSKLSRLIVFQGWDGTTLNYNQFNGGAAGGDALTNGIQIEVDNRPLFPQTIKAQKDYMRYMFDTDVVVDTLGASKRVYFTSRLSFHKFMGNRDGIDLNNYDLVVKIQDPISSFGANGEVTWCFEGWEWDR